MPDDYKVDVSRSVRRELEALRDPLLARVIAELSALSSNPRPAGCRKLAGGAPKYRIRVGDYRILYEVIDSERLVLVSRIRHRSQAYK